MQMKTKALLLGATLLGEMLVGPVLAGDWTMTDIGTLGGSGAFGFAINDLGQVVGNSRVPGDTTTHSFFYANGVMQDISVVNSGATRFFGYGLNNLGLVASCTSGNSIHPAIYNPFTQQITDLGTLGSETYDGFGNATGINDFGVAVGYSYFSSGAEHAFVYSNGHMTDLRTLGGSSGVSDARAINNAGTIVGGSSYTVGGMVRAVIWVHGSILDISQGMQSDATDINDSGDVVGTLTAIGRAYLWHNGTMQMLGTLPGGTSSYASGINNRGEIVGTGYISTTNRLQYHAFIYRDGNMFDINNLVSTNSGYVMANAFGINNSDQILCWGTADDGISFHTFIVQAPEPSVCSLVAASGIAWFVYRRKRRIRRGQREF